MFDFQTVSRFDLVRFRDGTGRPLHFPTTIGQIEWLRRIYTQVADWTVYQSHGLHARGSQQEREQKIHMRMCCLQQDQCQVSCKEALQDHRALSGLNA